MISRLLYLFALLALARAGPVLTNSRSGTPVLSHIRRVAALPPNPNPGRLPSHLIPKGIVDPSQSPTPSSSPSPSPSRTPHPATPIPCPSPAPTDSVGKFLGTVGLETPEFVKRCKTCCRKTKKRFSGVITILRLCDRCRIKKHLETPSGGPCVFGKQLGYSKEPFPCFYERCHQMLLAKGPCMCLVRF